MNSYTAMKPLSSTPFIQRPASHHCRGNSSYVVAVTEVTCAAAIVVLDDMGDDTALGHILPKVDNTDRGQHTLASLGVLVELLAAGKDGELQQTRLFGVLRLVGVATRVGAVLLCILSVSCLRGHESIISNLRSRSSSRRAYSHREYRCRSYQQNREGIVTWCWCWFLRSQWLALQCHRKW